MDLQGALQQLQAHVRTQVEIVLTNLAGVATREHFDEALYNRFLASRQSIPVIYGQMLGWSNQLNNMAFAQGLQSLAEALNAITLDVDASLQQGIDDTRKQGLIQGVTNADAVMSAFLQQNYATIVQYYNSINEAPQADEPPPPAPEDGEMPPPPPEDDSPFDVQVEAPVAAPTTHQAASSSVQIAQPVSASSAVQAAPNAAISHQSRPQVAANATGGQTQQTAPAPFFTAPSGAMAPPAATMGVPSTNPTSASAGVQAATGMAASSSNPTLNRTQSSMLAQRVSWAPALNDLISTEQEYIQMITSAANAYDQSFKANLPRMKKLLSESDLGSIQSLFSGLSLISKCHSQFLTHIEAARAGTEPLGGAIKTMVITLKVYTDYMTNLDNNIEILRKSRKSKDFTKFLDECKAKNGSHQQEIESICAHTFKRLSQYDGLINAFIVNMLPTDQDYNDLKESQQLVRKVAEYIAQARSAMAIRNKIIVIQQRVSSLPQGLNLVAPHRVLLRELDMDVRAADAKKAKDMTVYAFNDMILLTRTKGLVSKEEVCEAIISYHDHRVEGATENDRAAFRMVDPKKGAGFLFIPPDAATRGVWLNEIKAAIEQLKNSRATALVDHVDENELQTKLQVRILAGRDLVQSLYEPPDLYVQVSLGTTHSHKSAVREKCRFNPEWEDRFVLPVKNPYEDVLTVEVKERAGDVLLGTATLPLDELYDHVEKLGWWPLKSEMANNTLEPELLIGLMVAPTLTE
jgi:hypothetical protein